MKTIEMKRYNMLVRVRDFGRTYASRLPESTFAGALFATIDAVVDQLGEHTVARLCATRDAAAVRGQAREALRDRLVAMSRTAQAFGTGTPDVQAKFRLPDSADDQTLLATGRMFLRDGKDVEQQFTGHGLPPLSDLDALVSRFADAIAASDAGHNEHTAAIAGMEAAIEAGLEAMRKIDAIVTNVLGAERAVMAVWERARQVHYPRRKKTAPASDAAQPTTPQPAPAPASPVSPAPASPVSSESPVAATPPVIVPPVPVAPAPTPESATPPVTPPVAPATTPVAPAPVVAPVAPVAPASGVSSAPSTGENGEVVTAA